MVGRRLRRAVVGSLLVAEGLVPVGVVGGGVAAAEVPSGVGFAADQRAGSAAG